MNWNLIQFKIYLELKNTVKCKLCCVLKNSTNYVKSKDIIYKEMLKEYIILDF